jgi:peptide/nickel transport system ATP-binding protein/glutathione transport system ATP-binding protein
MTRPLLAVENLSVAFGATTAVRSVSFTVAPGETVAIVGESGSGKSATALAVMRLVEREGGRIVSGRVTLADRGGTADLTRLDEAAMTTVRGARVAMVFQEPMTALNPVLTVGEQVMEPLRRHQGLAGAAARAAAVGALERVLIGDPERRLGQYPHELSGGMRQRVLIAMALACRPSLLIADEPTTALDVTTQAEILALLGRLRAELGMGLLFITHDMGVVAEIAERVVVMRRGEVVETAPTPCLFAAPAAPYARVLIAAAPRLGEGSPPPLPATRPVLEVERLTVSFGAGGWPRRGVPVAAVRDASFTVGRGETLGIVGESGSGKSTLVRAALRLVAAEAGAIRFLGADVGTTPAALKPLRRGAQMIFQDPFASLNPRLPVWDQVTEPAAIHSLARGRQRRRELAADLLRRVSLPEDAVDRYPHQFSGGQRQRLCIARALSAEPALVVADESVSALDVSIARQVTELLADIQARTGLALIFISHDVAVVERMSHRIVVMRHGEIVETGATAELLRAPRHPYTRALIAAVPSPEAALRRRGEARGAAASRPEDGPPAAAVAPLAAG